MYQNLNSGPKPPKEIYVVIEIPQGSNVKYELDKENNVLFVDRFLYTSMFYPFNYGFVPQTLAEDGDPVDVLVLSENQVVPGSVIKAKPIGVLIMEDEAGQDEKIIAVPLQKIDPIKGIYEDIKDVPDSLKNKIKHFFEYYKTLEPGKWVKVKKWLGKKEAEKMAFKKIDIFKAINLIKKLTLENGGVLSHQGSVALPSPSAQSLLALFELNKIYPERNILTKEELEKRVEWLTNLKEWKDWEGHPFNCFAASTSLWALAVTFDSISEGLKRKVAQTIRELSLKIIDNFDEEERGWSWNKNVKPTFPFYTFFAIKSLKEAKKFLTQEILEKVKKIEVEAVEGSRDYLKTDGDYGNTAMSLWTIYEVLEEKIKNEKLLAKIYDGIEKMETIPLHTRPIEFHIQIMVPTVIIPMVKIAPESIYTIKAVKRFLKWMKETQEEGWRWVHAFKDTSWATAQVLLAYATIIRTPEVLQEIL